jgi:hypothetical protein
MDPPPRKYSQQRYWRFVFTPLILALIGFGLYILFTMPDTQSISLDDVKQQLGKIRTGNANSFSNVSSVGSRNTI